MWGTPANKAGKPCGRLFLSPLERELEEVLLFNEGTYCQRGGAESKKMKWTICICVLELVKITNLHFRTFFMFISILPIVLGLDATW